MMDYAKIPGNSKLEQLNSTKNLSKMTRGSGPAKTEDLYQLYLHSQSRKKQRRYLWKLLKQCHKNTSQQQRLAKMLSVPFEPGPMSINELPGNLLRHDRRVREGEDETTQLEFLFQYLKNVREAYFCWIIYYNEELQVLNIKLLREDQLQDYQELFNPNINLIGIFIQQGRQQFKCPPIDRGLRDFYSGDLKGSHDLDSTTPEHSTGHTWMQQRSTQQQQPRDQRSHTKSTKNKIKIRSLSPKAKIISVSGSSAQLLKSNESAKIQKSQSVLGKRDKSKSSTQLIRQHQARFHFKGLQQKEETDEVKKEGKPTLLKRRFKKKSRIQMIEDIYKRKGEV